MTLRIRKVFKPIAGMKLNVGKGGLSSTIGLSGLSASVGSKGNLSTNIGLPGSGTSYRTTLNCNSKNNPVSFDDELEIEMLKPHNNILQKPIVNKKVSKNTVKKNQKPLCFWPWTSLLILSCVLVSLRVEVIPVFLCIFATWQIKKITSKVNYSK